jgi:stage II sporulation protein D
MVQNAKTMKRPYHVQNTNKHQTYGGGRGMDLHRKAVEETNGLFLSHESKPITAMFDGCCGGVITKDMQGIDFKKAPYLARSYPCTFCKNFKVFSWQADYDVHELEKILKMAIPGLRRLREIKITKKDKAGIVQQVEIKGAGHTYTLSGKKIYSLLSAQVKSFYFSIEKHGRIITIKGKGRGHHLGLCQWGAKEMIAQGYDYKSVLEFYYPGSQLMRLI